jgi:hypothetical protein
VVHVVAPEYTDKPTEADHTQAHLRERRRRDRQGLDALNTSMDARVRWAKIHTRGVDQRGVPNFDDRFINWLDSGNSRGIHWGLLNSCRDRLQREYPLLAICTEKVIFEGQATRGVGYELGISHKTAWTRATMGKGWIKTWYSAAIRDGYTPPPMIATPVESAPPVHDAATLAQSLPERVVVIDEEPAPLVCPQCGDTVTHRVPTTAGVFCSRTCAAGFVLD